MTVAPLLLIISASLLTGLAIYGGTYAYYLWKYSPARAVRRSIRQIAIHEASHAVIAWHSPVIEQVKRATVIPDSDRTGTAGRVVIRYRQSFPEPAATQQTLLMVLAGMAGETILGDPGLRGRHRCDQREASRTLECLRSRLKQPLPVLTVESWQATLALICHHRRAIVQVADALQYHGCLDTADLECLLGPRLPYEPPQTQP